MSLPPPPGPKQPSSLPPRPPSSFKPAYSSAPSYSSPGTTAGASHGARPAAFTAFAPRAVASNLSYRTSSPDVLAAAQPTTAYQQPAAPGYPSTYQNPHQSYQAGAQSYYGQQSGYGDSQYGASSVPQIANPFPVPGEERKGYGRDSGMDPEMEAQIAQWQSAYMTNPSEDGSAATSQAKLISRPAHSVASASIPGTPTYSTSTSHTPIPTQPDSKTVVRSGGGQTWTDSTLLEWDPAHFRLFVGNLAGEVTDDSLKKAFSKYPSIQKARVIRDKRTEKSRGYGFISFSDGDDYFKAGREMQGKYIGSHPILLRRAMTEVRPVQDRRDMKGKKNGHGGGGKSQPQSAVGGSKPKGDGVKKQGYTRGGLKILG
uniref:Putative RNA-binding protein C22E12.02 n=1 Tax=Talaromyces marneffei PM1 TaxID=1077442 RepID=A0A093XM42_TALMA